MLLDTKLRIGNERQAAWPLVLSVYSFLSRKYRDLDLTFLAVVQSSAHNGTKMADMLPHFERVLLFMP